MHRFQPVAELFATGRIVDCIVALMLIELFVLTIVRSRKHCGIETSELAASLAAGMAILFALRAALVGFPWQYVAVWLLLSLASHLLYLKLRWNAQ